MPYFAAMDEFAEFQKILKGTWSNKDDLPGTQPDENPFSYNVMPLPQISVETNGAGSPQANFPGYILKNFKYKEEVRFNSDEPVNTIPTQAVAPNRGGRLAQTAFAMFYDQKVMFAEGPASGRPKNGSVVHVENGTWIYLKTGPQTIGPYSPPSTKTEPGIVEAQPDVLTVAKQISVPHGNSVLALGTVEEEAPGKPTIPDAPPPYPTPAYLSVEPYTLPLNNNDDYQNPHPDLTQQPNKPIQLAVTSIDPDKYIHWSVTTKPIFDRSVEAKELGRGTVTNIPFEQRVAKVVHYWADYWLLFKNGEYRYLAYTQTMSMLMVINGQQYEFPHVTCNVVTKET